MSPHPNVLPPVPSVVPFLLFISTALNRQQAANALNGTITLVSAFTCLLRPAFAHPRLHVTLHPHPLCPSPNQWACNSVHCSNYTLTFKFRHTQMLYNRMLFLWLSMIQSNFVVVSV